MFTFTFVNEGGEDDSPVVVVSSAEQLVGNSKAADEGICIYVASKDLM